MFSTSCATTSDYRLRTGDELRIVIWNKLDEKVIIRPDYKITLPLIGETDCRHKGPETLSKELSKQYKTKVTVAITKYHTRKDDFKDVLQLIRDSAILYFIGKRISE
jgi:protein involved in polysaccharide export with SLBB domain